MSKLAHSNQETMDQIEANARAAEERGERDEPAQVVTPADWRRSGFNDGRHGNSSWPPKGHAESRSAYLDGFRAGRAELSAFRRAR